MNIRVRVLLAVVGLSLASVAAPMRSASASTPVQGHAPLLDEPTLIAAPSASAFGGSFFPTYFGVQDPIATPETFDALCLGCGDPSTGVDLLVRERQSDGSIRARVVGRFIANDLQIMPDGFLSITEAINVSGVTIPVAVTSQRFVVSGRVESASGHWSYLSATMATVESKAVSDGIEVDVGQRVLVPHTTHEDLNGAIAASWSLVTSYAGRGPIQDQSGPSYTTPVPRNCDGYRECARGVRRQFEDAELEFRTERDVQKNIYSSQIFTSKLTDNLAIGATLASGAIGSGTTWNMSAGIAAWCSKAAGGVAIAVKAPALAVGATAAALGGAAAAALLTANEVKTLRAKADSDYDINVRGAREKAANGLRRCREDNGIQPNDNCTDFN